jgi:hypothetical protein
MKRKEQLFVPEIIQVKLCDMVNTALHCSSRIGFSTKTRDEMDGCHNLSDWDNIRHQVTRHMDFKSFTLCVVFWVSGYPGIWNSGNI